MKSTLCGLLLLLIFCNCTDQVTLVKESEVFVYAEPPFLECHASTIEEIGPNKFMVSAFGGTEEKDPDVCIWVSTENEGRWNAPRKVADGVMNDSLRYPTWNPVLYKTASGKLQLYYKVGPTPRDWWGMVMESGDSGETWEAPRRLPDGILGPIKNKPIALADGTLISPSSTEESVENGVNWKVHMELSSDMGKTWERIPIDPQTQFNVIQPTLLSYPGGKLQALCRSMDNSVIQAFSEDNGKTWGPMTRTELPNPSAGVDGVTLSNGWQLLVYNPTVSGKGGRAKLNVAISKDGERWTDAVILENEEQGEFSYPAVIQAANGKVHITYTYNRVNIKHVVLDLVD